MSESIASQWCNKDGLFLCQFQVFDLNRLLGVGRRSRPTLPAD